MEDNKTKEEILADEFHVNLASDENLQLAITLNPDKSRILKAMEAFSQQSTKQLQDRVKELESWKFQARNIMYDLWTELQNTGYSSSKAELIAKTNAFMNPDLLNTKS